MGAATFVAPHPPIASGDCARCHAPHASAHPSQLRTPLAENCAGCHAASAAWSERAVVHDPVTGGGCLTCHEVHGGDVEGMLTSDVPGLCLDCHDTGAAFVAAHSGRSITDADCTACHGPHASDQPGLLRAHRHAPFAANDCGTCHDALEGGGGFTIAAAPGDMCLKCHRSVASYKRVGNRHNLDDGPGGAVDPIAGDAAGHNINAPGHGLAADGTFVSSPGGTYPAGSLRCTSCHDPHGNQNYRFLRGPGASPDVDGAFPYNALDATGLDIELGGAETDANHIAYRGDVSRWCGNCHLAYLSNHDSGGHAGHQGHPTDRTLSFRTRQQYNIYNGTADPTGGQPSTAYLAAVPFMDAANTTSSTAGPGAASRVMCLTCHRAHASSAPHAGRWDFNVATLGEDGVVSGSYPIPNPYTDPAQTSLCYKCHGNGMVHGWVSGEQ